MMPAIRIRFQCKLRDCWVGVYWRWTNWSWHEWDDLGCKQLTKKRLNIWMCFLPCLPLSIVMEWIVGVPRIGEKKKEGEGVFFCLFHDKDMQ